ncbi:MAG TPA: class I SAM-dependent methyltransferase [Candidatus Binataceae bacterium]|nr:class I SAM-dependent methyltransferase [Candidatus Binataceae bacterium]
MAELTTARPYTAQFYERHRDHTAASAAIIVPIVMSLVAPASVLDIGCGIGQWLGAFRDAGVQRVLGLDGAYVDRKMLFFPPEFFREADLEKPLAIPERFDLACSLEVAEHLSEGAGTSLVAELCAAAPVVLFSAAIPWQGGDNHINERWPSHWIAKFAERGYRVFDPIRPRIIGDSRVTHWYRQNLLMFGSEEAAAAHPALATFSGVANEAGLEWVHISVHHGAITDHATLLRARGALRRKIVRVSRRWLRLK